MKKQKINSPVGAVLIRSASKKDTNKEGITLIALVVTVIVLLILAGITLSLIGGSEGILGRATSAVEENEKATAKEQAELAIQEIQMEYMEEKYVNDSNAQSKKDYILDKLKDGVQTQDYYMTATEDGKVIVYEGSNDSGREISKVFVDENGSIQWQEDISTYTIAYDGNGATEGNMEASVCNYDEESTLKINGFTRANHKFLGWNTMADGSGTTYQDGQSILNLTERGYVLTLYAQWKENPKATTTISNSNFGEYVDYSANGISDWRIFLNDGSNIYLISSYYVPNSGIKSGIGINKTGTYGIWSANGSTLMNAMLNTNNWAQYANGTSAGVQIKGATATGGPTLAQFWNSYNKKYGTSYANKDYSRLPGRSGDDLYFLAYNAYQERQKYMIATMGYNNKYVYSVNSAAYRDISTVGGAINSSSCGALRVIIKLPTDAAMRKEGNKWIIET